MKAFKYRRAGSLAEAVALLADPHIATVPLAGGTDLLGTMKDNIHPDYPEILVDIKRMGDLEYIRPFDGGLEIGAMVRLTALASDVGIEERYPMLARAARSVASPQIRNMGTIGGNICQEPRCWYYRYPNNFFFCLRKGGHFCPALNGDNRYHAIFGADRLTGAACTSNCPTDTPVPDYLARIREGDLAGAAEMVLTVNPIPAVTGRVCPHFCRQGCARKEYDQALSIRSVERYLGDWILENPSVRLPEPAKPSGYTVAVVGSGPAGLAAAFYLCLKGHQVTVFERRPKAGGMLTYAIPAYRLPKDVVDRLIEALSALGIVFQTDTSVDHQALEALSQSHDAVFVAGGAWKERSLGIEGESLAQSGLEILNRINSGRTDIPAGRVAVIGGGNVALDVARSLKRLGAEPVILYRRTESDMPAIEDEIGKAREEGVNFEFLTQPVEITSQDNRLALKCIRMKPGEPDASGRARPEPVAGTETVTLYDAVAKAIGETGETQILSSRYVNNRGRVSVETDGRLGGNLYAGGDYVTGPSTVVEAVSSGRRCARSIQAFLTGEDREVPADDIPPGEWTGHAPDCRRYSQAAVQPERAVRERMTRLDVEDQSGLTPDQVESEARRCFNCGCVAVTPSDIAPVLVALEAAIITSKRTIPAERFFTAGINTSTVLDPDEIVTGIALPPPSGTAYQCFLKIRPRQAIDFPVLNLAVMVNVQGNVVQNARIVFGAAAPTPVRAVEAEIYLAGRVLQSETIDRAAQLSVAGARPLEKNAYKVRLARALAAKALTGIMTDINGA